MYPASVTDVVDQPNLLVEKPEDLERYARGDLLDFLLLLDDDQKRFVDWGLKGPTLVKGGPGSGKSTVAMYRIRSLVAQPVEKGKKISILFTTYTNALVEFSRQLIDRLMKEYTDRPVQYEVSTLDRIAMKIHGEPRPTMAEARDLSYALASARAVFSPQGKSPLEAMMITNAIKALREDYLLEEFDWVIDGQGLNSLEEYQAVDRTGRGYAFDGRMREAVWSLYDHTCQFLKSMGKTRWGELRRTALERVRSGAYAERYDYIVIDEAQDLTPTALALCVELCKSPQGIFLTADASQSLYNRGFAWKNVHASLKVTGRTRLLKRNYRTTRQIAEAAVSMLNKSEAGDPEALDQYYVHTGPHPTIYAAADESDAFLWLADTLTEAARSLHLPTGAIAVLAPTNNLAKEAARFLSNCGLDTSYFTGKEINLQSPNAKALTIHSCKGLEFPIVAIPYAEVHLLPRDLEDERAEDLEKHLDQERRLLFVGMTRAMRRLYVVHRQGHASPFLDGLAPGLWIQQKFQ
jgi:superfamily I DNA/RNA helicase